MDIYQTLAMLMIFEPHSKVAQLTIEFAERTGDEDSQACLSDPQTVAKIKAAQQELTKFLEKYPDGIANMADAIEQCCST